MKNKSFYSTKYQLTKTTYQILEYNELNYLIKISEFSNRHRLKDVYTYTYDNNNKVMGICLTVGKRSQIRTIPKERRDSGENFDLFQPFNPYPII